MTTTDRNLTPHKAACAAMYLFPKNYADSGGGSMDFWDSLSERDQKYCERCVEAIAKSCDQHGADALVERLESVSNFMRGVMLDPRLPRDMKNALLRETVELDVITVCYNS